MSAFKRYFQRRFVNWLVHDLFNAIDERDILVVDAKKGILYKGGRLKGEEIETLIRGAETLSDMLVWKMLRDEVKYQANQRMYFKSNTTDDILFGKAALWTLLVMEEKLNQLRSLRKKPIMQ